MTSASRLHSTPRSSNPGVARLVDPCPPPARPAGRTELVASPVRRLEAHAHAQCVKSTNVPYIQEEQEVLAGIHLVEQIKKKFLHQ
jgi:hypothetical protein